MDIYVGAYIANHFFVMHPRIGAKPLNGAALTYTHARRVIFPVKKNIKRILFCKHPPRSTRWLPEF